MIRSFEDIGRSVGTDKVTHHGYHRFYPIFLEKYRSEQIIMLEIGVCNNSSLRLWEEYLPFSKIYGIDIETGFKHERGEVFMGNQSDTVFLQMVVQKIGAQVDLIIDDGSHKPEHQLKTFVYLFHNLLKDGGIYIIEDIETNYWKEGYLYGNLIQKGYQNQGSIIEIFKNVIDKLNAEFVKDKSVFASIPIPECVQNKVGLVSFQHNCLVIIKKNQKYSEFDGRTYRFHDFL